MCLPAKPDHSSSTSGLRSYLGIGALMLAACLGGPLLIGAIGSLGAGFLLGAGGVIVALVLCAVVPALALRTRTARRRPTVDH